MQARAAISTSEQLGNKRIRFSDEQRRRLAVRGRALTS